MTLATVSRALLLLVLCAAPAAAQETHVFQADKDLEGFEAAGFSEFHELYTLAEFKANDGKSLAPAELVELRARWQKEKERAGKRIALIQSDPRERWVWLFEKRLAKHGYFSKISYTIERPEPGYVMVVQRPAKDDPQYVARLAGFYMPFVKKAVANFEQNIAQPAGLVRGEGREMTAFAVLATSGDVENFGQFVQDPTGYSDGSAYDYQLQLAVTFEDPFASGNSVVAQRSRLLYCVVKGLQHAYLSIPGNRPGSIWLYEGLAFLFSSHEGAAPESLDTRAARPKSFDWLVGLLGKQPAREIVLMPLDELVSQRSWIDFEKAIAARTKSAQADAPEENDVGRAYYAQSELWLHFLFDGAQGKYRKPLTEFIKLAFQGRGDEKDLQRAFGITDLRALSREFLRWACDEYERRHPGKKAERAPIDTLFSAEPAAGAAASEPAPIASPEFSPRDLAPAQDDGEAQFALALLQAREGDPEGAAKALDALAARAPASPAPERIAREKARFAELGKLRAGYLAFLKAGGGKLTFKVKGKDVMAPVTAVENGLVRLGENKLGLPSIGLDQVDPYEVAKVAAKKEQQGEAQPWTRFYAYALAGDARWEKLLKDDAPGAKELRADGKEYAALARTALAARELYELSKLALPRDATESAARLGRVKAFLAANTGSGILERRVDALRQLAKASLATLRQPGDPSGLLHAKSEHMDDGRTRFTWDFDAQEEGEDWRRETGYLKAWRDLFRKIPISEADSRFTVEQGHFNGLGQITYRSVAAFEGPITVRLRYRYVTSAAEHSPPAFYVMICDDGAGSYIVAGDPGFVRVRDLKQNYDREASSSDKGSYYLDEDFEFEIVDDGKEVSTSLDKKPLATASCGPRRSGDVLLFAHTDLSVSIDQIVIEGALRPGSLRDLESRWVERQLRALGFP
jgi:hypothetical protein